MEDCKKCRLTTDKSCSASCNIVTSELYRYFFIKEYHFVWEYHWDLSMWDFMFSFSYIKAFPTKLLFNNVTFNFICISPQNLEYWCHPQITHTHK